MNKRIIMIHYNNGVHNKRYTPVKILRNHLIAAMSREAKDESWLPLFLHPTYAGLDSVPKKKRNNLH